MKTIHRPIPVLLAALAFLLKVQVAPAQTGWGNALSFDGTNDSVVMNPGVSLSNTSFTIEFWAKRQGGGMQCVVSQGVSSTGKGLHILFNGSAVTFNFWADDLSGTSAADGLWHHWAFIYNATNRARIILRDSMLVASNTAAANFQGAGPLHVGNYLGDSHPFAGCLDDFRVWNTARTPGQIAASMSDPLTGSESSLLAYWKLDEGAGAIASDATVNAFNGVLIGEPAWTRSTLPQAPISWGSAMSLDGSNDRIQVTGFSQFPSTNITVEFWMRSANTSKEGTPISYAVSGSGDNVFVLYDYRNFKFQVDNTTASTSGVSANDGQWHHIAVTWSSASGACRIYKDGGLAYQTTVAAGHVLANGGTLVLGQEQDSLGGGFDSSQAFLGDLDEVRIWNMERSQDEIQAGMLHPMTGAESGLVAYWKFDESTGDSVLDSTTHGLNATLYNGPTRSVSTLPQAPTGWFSAMSFDGVNDHVSATIPAMASNYTFSAWVCLRSGGNNQGGKNVVGVLSATNSGTSAEVLIHGTTGSIMDSQYLQLGRHGAFSGSLSTTNVPLNQWAHIAITVTSNKLASYFINGIPAGSYDASAWNLTLGPNISLGDNTVRHFNGMLDEVRIWNRALSQAEIAAGRLRPLTGYEPGLVACYRFNEGGAGILAYDATPNHRNGTLHNRPLRVPSTIPPLPIITVLGDNPMYVPLHASFTDPGATAGAGFAGIAASAFEDYPNSQIDLALRADGSVVSWGDNHFGEGVVPASASNVVAVSAGNYHNLALRTDGSITGWGAGDDNDGWPEYNQCVIPENATNIVGIVAGRYRSAALRADGSVVGWGKQSLAIASAVVEIKEDMALRTDGSVLDWEGNTLLGTGAVAISGTGGNSTVVLRSDGSVWDGYYGYIYGNPIVVPANAGNPVVAIARGADVAMALRADGSVVTWSEITDASHPTPVPASVPPVPASACSGVVGVAAGRSHFLALKADGSIVSWGGQTQVPVTQRTLCPGLTAHGTVNVDLPGTYVVTYTVTNALGVVGTASRTVVVVPDTTPPALPDRVVLIAPSGSSQAALSITATDNSGIAPVVTSVPPQGTPLAVGPNLTNVLCTATDASGNSTTGIVKVLVLPEERRLAPAGEIWTSRLALTNPVMVASSADGARLVAAEKNGHIHTSSDAGLTWTSRMTDTNRDWTCVVSSADGNKLAAAEWGHGPELGRIYTSTNGGLTWTARGFTGLWRCLASSADGSRLVAGPLINDRPGFLDLGVYVSTNSGATWTTVTNNNADQYWTALASSADGTRLIGNMDDNVYTSTNGGLSWTPGPTAGFSIGSSADGMRLIAAEYLDFDAVLQVNPDSDILGSPHTSEYESQLSISTDGGGNWTTRATSLSWTCVASSADGTKLVAGSADRLVHFSADSGATWKLGSTMARWSSIASSTDGNALVAGTSDGEIYTSIPTILRVSPMTFAGATNQVVELSGPLGAVVTFNVIPTSGDAVGPVICTPPSGTNFSAGTNIVTCSVVDVFGGTNTSTFLVVVRSTQPPTDIVLSNSTVPENQPLGTTIGNLTVIDELGDAHRLELVPGAGDTDNAWFAIAGNLLQPAAILSYEYKSSYSIRVRATDSGDFSIEKVFTITVVNQNDAPVLDIRKVPGLDFARINAGAPIGVMGTAVTNLVDLGGPLSDVTDEDAGAVTGVAITGANTNAGTWHYTMDNGTNWNPLGTLNESSARLLAATPDTRVYFQPNTNFIGTIPGALTFRAWDQTSGGNGGIADTTSNGWTTAFSSDAVAVDQEVGWGYALSLDGADDYLTMPEGVWFGNAFTIETWVYPRSHTTYARIVSFTTAGSANGLPNSVSFCTSFESTGRPSLRIFANSGASTWLVAPAPLPLNRWSHVAVTLQTNRAFLYINGVTVTNGPVTANPTNRTINYIGRSTWTDSPPDPNLNAMLDELRIWNVARTPQQITNNLLNTLPDNQPGLMAYYRFDEGKGLTAHDATTNHLDGVLTNGVAWVRSTVPHSLTPVTFVWGNTRYFQGYWPNGIRTNATVAVPNVVVNDLSTFIRSSNGLAGVQVTDDTSAVNLSVSVLDGDWGITTSNAPGILAKSSGAAGSKGSDATLFSSSGHGRPGVFADSVTVVSEGQVATGGTNALGISAQSQGGAGGHGGNGAGNPYSGGHGGAGGAGGQVMVQDNSGNTSTTGNNSQGILAVSLGGAGGEGGDSGSAGHGGTGGTGGNGGAARVQGYGSINTAGDNSSGILAVSQAGKGGTGGEGHTFASGGDGGSGGTAGAAKVEGSWAITTHGTNAAGITASSFGGGGGASRSGGWITGGGGSGGSSGNGGEARVDFGPDTQGAGTIETFGKDSHGIFAQSVGGFAGNGAGGGSIFSSAGGDGGSAGIGGAASITNRGTVTTRGQGSHALFAESVGGGGGSSGSSSGIFGGSAGTAKAGGDGGAVTIFNSGVAQTHGFNARGIFAQSVGGSGGNAGYSEGLFYSVGAEGGLGGNGSSVNVNNAGRVATAGADSTAIFAQSVGGGGGTGGGSGAFGVGASVAVGGSGGGGGNGGNVTVASGTNSITTRGTNSHGIMAQSVGGGGGKGGYALSASANVGGASGSVALGGSGGGGGNASKVAVTSGSTIATSGSNSHGIFAQSVGGGGGEGGFGLAVSGGLGYSGAMSLGGGGGSGGSADSVAVTNTGAISTTNGRSHGILAQSVGGGGGTGGFSVAAAAGGMAALPVSIGGSGGDGGEAGSVAVNNRNAISTEGDDSHGIFAQSVGGGGGAGGFSVSAGLGDVYGGAFGMGGSGGGGGDADQVTVSSGTNSITTRGTNSHGIFAQSVGGGGGDGGLSVSAAGGGVSLSAAFGGSGGDGGNGSAVNVNSASRIVTQNDGSHGIFAQSVGGGGGSGGIAASASGGGAFAGSFGIGGTGGGGGGGDVVHVTSAGGIDTSGDGSHGILAQSVGGGGGVGGLTVGVAGSGSVSLSSTVGGTGGLGGHGSAVIVDSASAIATGGSNAHGIFAQSVGGGGGSGGISIAASGGGDVAASFSVGGSGSVGGDSGSVRVNSGGAITTIGDRSYGILAQSVGGGGGDGGVSVAGAFSGSAAVPLSFGGTGDSGGLGDNVMVTNRGAISTAGKSAHGIFAQSVGGGGGSGGFSISGNVSGGAGVGAAFGGSGSGGASAGNVHLTTSETISTRGDNAFAILAQSIGGGGGDGGFSVAGGVASDGAVSLGMGGSGGTGGVAGSVAIASASSLSTHGTNAHGIFAQSVGGGGGSGGFSVAAGISGSGAVSASLGGKGGSGADARTVTVTSTGETIQTDGNRSFGLLAQSVGGGGGDGGFSVAGGISKGPSANFSMGGGGGVAGNGDVVVVTNRSTIETHGRDSHGIFVQSVGGGGGSGGFSVAGGISSDGAVSASIGGAGNNGGKAGNVTLESGGDILTSGDRAHGILAQSVGGGGGDGGFSVAGGISKGPTVTLSLGGGGGDGGAGGAVLVVASNSITTVGTNAHGIFAQSVGGGGGSGGFSVSGGLSLKGSLSASVGGNGGSGSSASNVTVISRGVIDTSGNHSYGILAQSVGGGGGDGGFSFAGAIAKGPALAFALGGSGSTGGVGRAVSVLNTGNITTRGAEAHGVLAQSVGGGGGSGGWSGNFAFDAKAMLTNSKSISLSASVGGKGGGGGAAGSVAVTNAGSITTFSNSSRGILAQSIGGGGGSGGSAVSFLSPVGTNAGKSVDIHAAVGGDGGVGGNGSNVMVLNQGGIETAGKNSHGISAQSIGGGGGDGGDTEVRVLSTNDIPLLAHIDGAAEADAPSDAGTNDSGKSWSVDVLIGAGGSGGAAGDGGRVAVANSGRIVTHDSRSHGILAQSIGGGGGLGGASMTGTGGSESDLSISASLGLGGKGGRGGAADQVLVDNLNSVATLGNDSHGIVAQSIGGGGGLGGAGVIQSDADNPAATVGLTTAVGSSGGCGGDGSSVLVRSSGGIATSGQASCGIVAQSIGGGGGNAGMSQGPGSTATNWSLNLQLGGQGGSGGKGGTVVITNTGAIATLGNDAHGALVQSIGGGGGNAGSAHSGEAQSWKDLNIAVGATGGTGNDAGSVVLKNTGSINTTGHGSMGVMAQSIGGGGGVGSTAGMGQNGRLGIGGSGGAAGDGNTVLVVQSGDVDTSGAAAQGIFAQSVGGGGGLAGNVDRGVTNLDNAGVGIAFAQDGGSAGDGGVVTVDSTGSITTDGSGANGIFAQSVGGGGGLGGSVGDGVTLDFAGSVGGSGTGGAVQVDHSGNIHTLGSAAHGIFAQSAGGSNGFGGSVRISVTGDVRADGANASGIVAQSTGGAGGGDISISIASGGTVHGGSGSGVGVFISGGRDNTLVNHGTITTANGLAGRSIVATTGNDTVQNYGIIIGSVDLGGGHNVFNNHPGSTFNLIGSLNMGAGSLLENTGLLQGSGSIVGNIVSTGTISPGNSAGSLNIIGNLDLMSSAKMTLEIGGRQQGSGHDFIQVSNGALFDGTLSLSLTNHFRPTSSDTFTLMQFASMSGAFDNAGDGSRLFTTDNLASFELSYTGTNMVASAFQSPDTDGDGVNDYDESLSGTDWTNRNSVLAIRSLARGADGRTVLQFASVPDKTYVIECSTNLGGMWWSIPATNVTFPSTNLCQWVDDGSLTGGVNANIRLYRIRLQLE